MALNKVFFDYATLRMLSLQVIPTNKARRNPKSLDNYSK
jgi:hypothetical protein